MEISVDEALINLESLQKDYQDFHDEVWKDESYSINAESLDVAIETIHKYQKMLEILEKVWNIPSCMIDKAECLDKIMETYRTVRRQKVRITNNDKINNRRT